MSNPEVRPAGVDDLDPLCRLFDGYRQFYGNPSDLAAARVFLKERLERGESMVFLAISAGAAVGFTQLYPSFSSNSLGRIFILNDLFVHPDARGKGIGARLLSAAVDFAAAKGAVRLSLSTAHTNLTAQSLYKSQGWVQDDRFLNFNFPLKP